MLRLYMGVIFHCERWKLCETEIQCVCEREIKTVLCERLNLSFCVRERLRLCEIQIVWEIDIVGQRDWDYVWERAWDWASVCERAAQLWWEWEHRPYPCLWGYPLDPQNRSHLPARHLFQGPCLLASQVTALKHWGRYKCRCQCAGSRSTGRVSFLGFWREVGAQIAPMSGIAEGEIVSCVFSVTESTVKTSSEAKSLSRCTRVFVLSARSYGFLIMKGGKRLLWRVSLCTKISLLCYCRALHEIHAT